MKKYLLAPFMLFLAITSNAQYTSTNLISGLDYPVALAIAPDGRFFITLKGGGNDPALNAKVDVYNSNATLQGTLWDFTDSSEIFFERGVLGVELDPDFTNNHYVYVFYNHKITSSFIRVVRLTETNGVGSNPTIILNIPDPHSAGNHTGGNIHFGPDGKLYVSIGDRAMSSNSQLLTNPFGKFLRINPDGTIPTDNPYYDDGDPLIGNDDRIWTYGHRNAFDFTFSTVNDSLYSTENGYNTWDEVNIIHKSENYGWPSCEGFYNYNSSTTLCGMSSSILPIEDWGPSSLPALTGIVIYDHTLMPEFTNHMLVGGYNSGSIYDLTLGNASVYDTMLSRTTVPVTSNALIDITVGNEGCLYLIDGGYTSNGKLKRVCPTGMSVDEKTKASFSIFPNPAAAEITLGISNELINGQMVIKNMIGQTVYSNSINSTQVNLDISSWDNGVYFVVMENNGVVLSQKLIKE